MQEANPIETRNVVNNPSLGSQIIGLIGNVVNTGASVYQAKLNAETVRNNSTGLSVSGTAEDPAARAARAFSAAPWVLPAIAAVVILALVALVRRR